MLQASGFECLGNTCLVSQQQEVQQKKLTLGSPPRCCLLLMLLEQQHHAQEKTFPISTHPLLSLKLSLPTPALTLPEPHHQYSLALPY